MRHYVFIDRAYVMFNIILNTSTQISEEMQLEKSCLVKWIETLHPTKEITQKSCFSHLMQQLLMLSRKLQQLYLAEG